MRDGANCVGSVAQENGAGGNARGEGSGAAQPATDALANCRQARRAGRAAVRQPARGRSTRAATSQAAHGGRAAARDALANCRRAWPAGRATVRQPAQGRGCRAAVGDAAKGRGAHGTEHPACSDVASPVPLRAAGGSGKAVVSSSPGSARGAPGSGTKSERTRPSVSSTSSCAASCVGRSMPSGRRVG